MIRTGDLVLQRYVVGHMLGEGGMGQVFRGRHVLLDMDVAIKVLHPGADQKVSDRFLREARTMAQVKHPNVVQIVDCAVLEGGQPCIVMEFLRGRSLESLQIDAGALSWQRVVCLMSDVLAGLRAIHEAGIVHRDLKPANVMVSGEGTLEACKIVDFGIAKADALESRKLTATGAIVGTPAYMAPEQAKGSVTTVAADIYALGTMMFDLLTGNVPFPDENPMMSLIARVTKDAPRAEAPPHLPPLPPDLVRLIADMLQRDPAFRPSSALDVQMLMMAIDADRGATSSPAPPPTPRAGAQESSATLDAPRARGAEPRARGAVVAAQPASRHQDTDPSPLQRPVTGAVVPARAASLKLGTDPTIAMSGTPVVDARAVLLCARLPPSRLAAKPDREWLAERLGGTGRGYCLGTNIWFARIVRPDSEFVPTFFAALRERFGPSVRASFIEVGDGFVLSPAMLSGGAELPTELQMLIASL